MRIDIAIPFCCLFFAAVPPGSEPSPMEAFSARPGAHIVWSTEIAHLDHDTTHAVFTALSLEDGARKIRGVRFDLS